MNIHPLISFQLLLPERNTTETMQNDPPFSPPHLPLPQFHPDHQLWAVAAWQDCTNYAPWSPTLSSALSCRSFMSSWNLRKASMPMGWMLRTRHTAWSCLRDRLSRVISSSNSLANLRISLVVGRIPCLRIYNNIPYNLFLCGCCFCMLTVIFAVHWMMDAFTHMKVSDHTSKHYTGRGHLTFNELMKKIPLSVWTFLIVLSLCSLSSLKLYVTKYKL